MLVIAVAAWKGYERYQHNRVVRAANSAAESEAPLPATPAAPQARTAIPTQSASFKCDGRTYCSQMTSCAEATFFLKNCPGVKMDGNNDGVPCEQQWCKR